MTWLKYVILLVATLVVLPMTGCLCSQAYAAHQVSKLMKYQGMSKDEVLRRVCEVEVAHYDADPPDYGDKIHIMVQHMFLSGNSYDDLKNHPELSEWHQWVVHGRLYGLATRHYAIKLTFDEAGIVAQQEVTWYIMF